MDLITAWGSRGTSVDPSSQLASYFEVDALYTVEPYSRPQEFVGVKKRLKGPEDLIIAPEVGEVLLKCLVG